jgi:hypothetical protein
MAEASMGVQFVDRGGIGVAERPTVRLFSAFRDRKRDGC